MSDESRNRLKATLGGFSEITALTQRAINAAMKQMATDRPELTKVDCEAYRGDSLKATIAEPLVSLKVTGASRAELEYTVRFGSGTLFFNYNPPPTFDPAGWVIAFNVSLDKVEVEQHSEEDKAVRAIISQPGDFSLESLFVTFNMGDIINFKKDSNFNGQLDERYMPDLGAILAKWYLDDGPMKERRNRTIGYNLRTDKPSSVNEQAPGFLPTSLKFQTYEYKISDQSEPSEGIPAGDNNMLLYLQMTSGHDFPKTAILPYSGNFASSGMDGTMSIAREIFWDNYLLRESPATELLHTLNKATYVWVEDADINNLKSPNWTIGVGDKSHSLDPTFFHWEPQKGNNMSWIWNRPKDKADEDEQNFSDRRESGYAYGGLTVNCKVNNTMSTCAGSNIITVTGNSDVKVESDCGSGSPSSNWSTIYRLHIWLSWETTITINAVGTGGLSIVLDLHEDKFKVDNDPLYYLSVGGYGTEKSEVEKKQNGLVQDLKNSLQFSVLKNVADALQKNLDSAARLVVPGLGVFTYKDPMFNNNGDLFIEIGYQ